MTRQVPDTEHAQAVRGWWELSGGTETFEEFDFRVADHGAGSERGFSLAALTLYEMRERWPESLFTVADYAAVAAWSTVFDHWSQVVADDIAPALNRLAGGEVRSAAPSAPRSTGCGGCNSHE